MQMELWYELMIEGATPSELTEDRLQDAEASALAVTPMCDDQDDA
jgi:hypothetical protein